MNPNTNKWMQMVQERNQLHAAWLKQILSMSSGGLALLVALSPQVPVSGPAKWYLAAAWVLLGLGVLSGAAATYAEVSLARRLTAEFQSQLLRDLQRGGDGSGMHPVYAEPGCAFSMCKPVMVLSLLGAVVCLVIFAVLRTIHGAG